MRIVRHYHSTPEPLRGTSVAIGNFDGVHRGHATVIAHARQIAARMGRPLAVMTFEPHPVQFFKPDAPAFRLTPLRAKARLISQLGATVLFAQAFNRAFATMEAEKFVDEVLVRGLGARHVVVGHDFHYGRGRKGTPALLQAQAKSLGVDVTVIEAVADRDGDVISSSRIREHLRAGEVESATRLLGHPWEIEGRVEGGRQLGRTIGFPTANLTLNGMMQPAFGVYTVWVVVDGEARPLPGVANFGVRPTVQGDARPLFEVHLFDFSGDLYRRRLRVALASFLRPEQKFDGLDALKAQIAADATAARALLIEPPVL